MGAGAPAEPSLRPWGVVFPLCSGDDGGSAAAGSLVQLGYFQRNGYERAQHCLGLLVMAAGIPLVALCVQSDGGPHTTGGTEPEDEP